MRAIRAGRSWWIYAGDAVSDDARARSVLPVLQPEGWALLQGLGEYDESRALSIGERLRAEGHDPATVAAVLTQARLRARACEKFGERACAMLFTEDGLEQSTRQEIATHHAERFRRAGLTSVADLGCGIGGDAMALASLDLQVQAVDRDELTAAVAAVNLRPFPTARVLCGSAEDHDPSAADGIWLDPARRRVRRDGARARRVHDPEAYEPPLSFVTALASRLGSDGADGPLGVKLSPAIDRAALPERTETQWTSWHGQVLEATSWFGPLAEPGTLTSALVIDRAGTHQLRRSATDPAPDDAPVAEIGAHLYEPDGAVLRAGLLAALATQLHARTVDPTIAYLTGEELRATPFARGFAVQDVMPFSLKALTSYLRHHRIGVLEIKKRGTAVEPEELRRRLRPRRFGDGSATLILTRAAGAQVVIVAQPHDAKGAA